jgi:hypothetical protein
LKRDQRLLAAIKRRLTSLRALLRDANDPRNYEDGVYRFYYQSFKVYRLQEVTQRMVAELKDLAPGARLAPSFLEIFGQGSSKVWETSHNRRWSYETRPLLEAFFHARYFLEMACRYGKEMQRAETTMPSGWAALLCLYGWR